MTFVGLVYRKERGRLVTLKKSRIAGMAVVVPVLGAWAVGCAGVLWGVWQVVALGMAMYVESACRGGSF